MFHYHVLKLMMLFFGISLLSVGCATTDDSESQYNENYNNEQSANNENYNDENSENENQQVNNQGSNYGDQTGDSENINNFNDSESGEFAENEESDEQLNNGNLLNNGQSQLMNDSLTGTNQADPIQNNLVANNAVQTASENISPDIGSVSNMTNPTAEIPVDGGMNAAAYPTQDDIMPLIGELWWIGYDFNRKDQTLKVQMLTKGRPEFDLLQEKNQAGQPELVVRFYGTSLRRKMRRSLNAEEFNSPVAFVRMREDPEYNRVDVILTLRENQKPVMFAKRGNVQLVFPIQDKYTRSKNKTDTVEYFQAQTLEEVAVLPDFADGSELPKAVRLARAYVPDPVGNSFDDAGIVSEENVEPGPEAAVDETTGLPANGFANEEFDLDDGIPNSADSNNLENVENVTNSEEDENNGENLNNDSYENNENNDEENQNNNDYDQDNNDYDQNNNDSATLYQVESFSLSGVAQDNFGIDNEDNSLSEENLSLGDNSNPEQLNIGNEDNIGTNVLEPETNGIMAVDDLGGSIAGPTDLVGTESEVAEEVYTGKPVMLEFFAAPLRQVLKAFSEQIGTNFIYPPGVGNKNITIKLKNVPWDAALNAILETYKLGMTQVSENVIRVDDIDKMNEYLELRDKANQAKILSQNRKILVVRLSNAKANGGFKSALESFFKIEGVNNRTSITTDTRTNTVFIEAPPSILSRAKSLISRLDVPEPMVEVMSRVVEVSRQARNFLGIAWNGSSNFDSNRGLGFGSLNFPNSLGSNFSVDPGVNSASTAGAVNFNVGSINNILDLGLRLKMEEARGTSEILQSSRVVVADRETASITAGIDAYFRVAEAPQFKGQIQQQGEGGGDEAAGGSTIKKVTFKLELKVKPEVTNDGQVKMKLNIISEVPNPVAIPGSDLSATNRSLSTVLKKRSGETAVIGGIYDTKKSKQEVGIPFFSSLPIIGALFRQKAIAEDQTELMMMITPTIMADDQGGGVETSSSSSNYDNTVSNAVQNAANDEYNNYNGGDEAENPANENAGENQANYNSGDNGLEENVNNANADYDNDNVENNENIENANNYENPNNENEDNLNEENENLDEQANNNY